MHDIRTLGVTTPPFAWSRYAFDEIDGTRVYRQAIGPSALQAGTLQNYGWKGQELVAFRLHMPSRIVEHNARDIDTNESSVVQRGNILAWEQLLTDRLDGRPITIEVRMDRQSILYTTLWLFAGAFAAAVLVLVRDHLADDAQGRKGRDGGDNGPLVRDTAMCPHGQCARISASVRSSESTDSSPKPVASDRASIRSTLLPTTPVRRDVPVLHDDVDRRICHRRIVPERRIAVDGPRDARPQLVVEVRHRQHVDVVLDFAHAVDVGDRAFRGRSRLNGIVTLPVRITTP